jgi:formate dehydrogenase iron-sulfur subunit
VNDIAAIAPYVDRDFRRVAMFLDLSLCIGCRACQVACKEWNELPHEPTVQTGTYQNPKRLSGDTWKQVKFIEKKRAGQEPVWLFYSDSCKHCGHAPCLEACPTGAIFRTAEGIVQIDGDVCNGNQHCVMACPFDVIHINSESQFAAKCTFCQDRLEVGMEPACAKVCPTDCIQFGERSELLDAAHQRVRRLQERGDDAWIYGEHELGGLGVFYLLQDAPDVYGLPPAPKRPLQLLWPAALTTAAIAVALTVAVFAILAA